MLPIAVGVYELDVGPNQTNQIEGDLLISCSVSERRLRVFIRTSQSFLGKLHLMCLCCSSIPLVSDSGALGFLRLQSCFCFSVRFQSSVCPVLIGLNSMIVTEHFFLEFFIFGKWGNELRSVTKLQSVSMKSQPQLCRKLYFLGVLRGGCMYVDSHSEKDIMIPCTSFWSMRGKSLDVKRL